MLEVPEWAECSVASATGLPVCLRRITKMITILVMEEIGVSFESLGTCNRHLEVVEMAMAKRSELPPITVTRNEFPAFMASMTSLDELA